MFTLIFTIMMGTVLQDTISVQDRMSKEQCNQRVVEQVAGSGVKIYQDKTGNNFATYQNPAGQTVTVACAWVWNQSKG